LLHVAKCTKLLREILNKNPDIGIPSNETHFIPYSIKRYSNQDFRPIAPPGKSSWIFFMGVLFTRKCGKSFLLNVANEKI